MTFLTFNTMNTVHEEEFTGEQIDIGMDANGYDSRHETKWGGACPGTTSVTYTRIVFRSGTRVGNG
jgi:hypothetical protein